MIIKTLKLVNFRSYDNLLVEFKSGINFIYGENGSGKTNILEGIYYLFLTHSFRTSIDSSLIKFEQGNAYVFGQIIKNNVTNNIEIILKKEGKEIQINNKKLTKISNLSKISNFIYFIPNDVNLMKESPKDRRYFLNLYTSKFDSKYLSNLQIFEKILKERNELLKREEIDENLLNLLTEKLIKISEEIYLSRSKLVKEINSKINDVFNKISRKSYKISLEYLTYLKPSIDYYMEAKDIFKNSLILDKEAKHTTKGIQKDDFKLNINYKDVSLYGSQGENRIAILALKLTIGELFSKEEQPIILLDDILSELDQKHIDLLINYLKKYEQVFITSTNKYEINDVNYYFVNANKEVKEV